MDRFELNQQVMEICSQYKRCTICPFWENMTCLMAEFPDVETKPKIFVKDLELELSIFCDSQTQHGGCETCVFSQHDKKHLFGQGCMARPTNYYHNVW